MTTMREKTQKCFRKYFPPSFVETLLRIRKFSNVDPACDTKPSIPGCAPSKANSSAGRATRCFRPSATLRYSSAETPVPPQPRKEVLPCPQGANSLLQRLISSRAREPICRSPRGALGRAERAGGGWDGGEGWRRGMEEMNRHRARQHGAAALPPARSPVATPATLTSK